MPRLTIVCLLLITLTAASQAAASIVYPDVNANTVWYRNIEESSPTGDPLPLYGQPAAVANQLVFPTTGNFSASSLDGGPSDQTDGRLSFSIEAKQGFSIDAFSIAESGLTSLTAPFGGDAYTDVNSFAVVQVLEVGGAPVSMPVVNLFLTISPLGGVYQLSVIGSSSYTSGWSGAGTLGLPENVTKVSITLDNLLFAATQGQGTRAFIDKKAFQIGVNTTNHNVPEPSSLALAGLGLVGCLLARRHARRRAG